MSKILVPPNEMSVSVGEGIAANRLQARANSIKAKKLAGNTHASGEKFTEADAGEIYQNGNYGREKDDSKSRISAIEKAKEYDEQLVSNEISHKADNVNQDYAYNKEILSHLPDGMPSSVKGRLAHRLEKEAHVDSTSSMEMMDDILKFHKKKTAELKADQNKRDIKDNPSVKALMDKYEKDSRAYESRQAGSYSMLETAFDK